MDIFIHLCSSVIKTKISRYFRNSFGRAKWVPDTQQGCEKLLLVILDISHPFWVTGTHLTPPKVSLKYLALLVLNSGTKVDEYIHFSRNDFLVFTSVFHYLGGASSNVA